MRYKKFSIKGYRAIEETVVEFNQNQLIPLIGINESGKTSILHAILAFDKSKDRVNRGKHLEYKNKYKIRKDGCEIKAYVYLESKKEVVDLMGELNPAQGDIASIELSLSTMGNNKNCFEIVRDLATKQYRLDNSTLPDRYHGKCIKYILKRLPFILYFDDFSDRVPESIEFKKDYDGEDSIKSNSQTADWQRLIEEIFKRSTNQKFSLKDFINLEDVDDRAGLISDIGDVLNKEIIEDWKQLKKRGAALADDEIDLELKLHFEEWETGAYSFNFKVVDKAKEGRSRQFNIVERSKGFQWFFNFTLKLKFNAKYKTNPSGAIYLLDEPGSYLHASAQEELLVELKKISETNVIFYCTHSQHLLNPDVINIASIKIASKEDGSVILRSFSSSKNANNRGALTPLYDALRLNIPLLEGKSDRIILTEGITDYFFIKLLGSYTDYFSINNVHVIPGAGAAHLKELISLIISRTDIFYVFFDNDDEGRKASKRYQSHFREEIRENFVFYGDKDAQGKFVLEDYFVGEDGNNLLSATRCQDVKAAITRLYYSEPEVKEKFFESLTDDFGNRIARLASKIIKISEASGRSDIISH